MIRRLNSQQKAELKARNEKFLAEHPGYYEKQQVENEDYEADHSAEIRVAKQGKQVYQQMNY